MLMPKRVKRRRVFRGRMKGKAQRGNFLAYGDFGLVATVPGWVTSNQIEAARIAMTRYIKRGGKFFIKTVGNNTRKGCRKVGAVNLLALLRGGVDKI